MPRRLLLTPAINTALHSPDKCRAPQAIGLSAPLVGASDEQKNVGLHTVELTTVACQSPPQTLVSELGIASGHDGDTLIHSERTGGEFSSEAPTSHHACAQDSPTEKNDHLKGSDDIKPQIENGASCSMLDKPVAVPVHQEPFDTRDIARAGKRRLLSMATAPAPAKDVTYRPTYQPSAQGHQGDKPAVEESCYKVMYTREAHKKRPRFYDGVLLVRNGQANAYDDQGKRLMFCNALRVKEKLPPGRTIMLNAGTHIEIDSEMNVGDFDSGRAFTMDIVKQPPALQLPKFKKQRLMMGEEAEKEVNPQEEAMALPKFKKHRLVMGEEAEKEVNPQKEAMAIKPAEESTISPMHGALMLAGAEQPWLQLEHSLARHLRPHQEEGVRFMFKHVLAGHGCILADSMGLGKTLQALCMIWATLSCPPQRPLCRKAAVVCPTTLCSNWEAECNKWLGLLRLRPLMVPGGISASAAAEKIRSFRCSGKIMIISYEQLRQHAGLLDETLDLIVCDEGHRLKSAEASTTKRLNSLRCKRRVLLTGTPLQNNLDEFWCCMSFVQPMILPPLPTFQRIYKTPIDRSQDKSASSKEVELGRARSAELARLSQKVILRRGPEILESLLPPRTELLLTVPLLPCQVATYKSLCGTKSDAARQDAQLGILSLLRQLCNMEPEHLRLHCEAVVKGSTGGIDLDDQCSNLEAPSSTGRRPASGTVKFCQLVLDTIGAAGIQAAGKSSAKLALLETLLRWFQKEAPTDGIVIVSGFTQALQRCADICASLHLRTWILTGATPVQSRLEHVNAFNAGKDSRVFLLSSRAGGVGLNIVGANRLIMLEPDWNPAVDQQAMGRVWRQGQTKPVYIYRFATHGTVEEKILQRQARKKDLASAALAVTAGSAIEGTNDMANLKEVFVLNGYTEMGVPFKCSDEEVLPPPSMETQELAGTKDSEVEAALYSIGLLGLTTTVSADVCHEGLVAS